ncbi:MAG TPA: ABC transporter, partial [Pasteurellaceae bacterium]|nr:ABC transporter [Pasteurellaceae bacterium]
ALAQILGKSQVAEEKLAALDTKITELKKLTQNKTALVVLVNESKISAYGDTSR